MNMLRVIVFISLASLCVTTVQAQMIDYGKRERRNRQNSPVKSTPQAPPVSVKKAAFEAVRVESRAERVYDTDGSGWLEQAEMVRCLKDVISSVEQWGAFQVVSSITETFDANGDGQIAYDEVAPIRDLARSLE